MKSTSYGPHPFLVDLRNKSDYSLLPGVTIGDVGPKNGVDVIDNGFIILDDVRVPVENLLGKLGYVDDDGEYQTKIPSNDQRFGLHMSPLSAGRGMFAIVSLGQTISALKIALNYVHHRRQFSTSPTQ